MGFLAPRILNHGQSTPSGLAKPQRSWWVEVLTTLQ
jgi:hypothetical protein